MDAPLPPAPAGWQAPTPEELGAVLGSYEVIGLLGRGGMGAVYRAVQPNLERDVAIKILPLELAGKGDGLRFVERFEQEAKSMAKLSHPAIIGVYDFGEVEAPEGDLLYFVMEFVEGMDVHQYIKEQGGKLPPAQAHAVACHVLDALGFAHRYGIVHRDIKPANILLDHYGRVKVADFGLAKSTTDDMNLTKDDVAMGTPDYIAPEALAGGREVDGRADLYAVGAMLYQSLTGTVPRGMFRPASDLVPGLDSRYDAIIHRALQGDPKDRYLDAAEFRADLDRIVTEPVPVASDSPQTAALKVARKEKPRDANASGKPASRSAPAASGGFPVFKVLAIVVLLAAIAWVLSVVEPAGSEEPAPPGAAASVKAQEQQQSETALVEGTQAGPDSAGTESELAGAAAVVTPPVVVSVVAAGKAAGEEIASTLGMKLCWIPAGKFTMGSPEGEAGRNNNEAQVETELTRGFWLGKYEVTQREYEKIAGRNPAQFKASGERAPVEQINRKDAMDFCAALSKHESEAGTLPAGWVYALPTEAQWEYACRAGQQGPYSGGAADELAWYKQNSGESTHEVGKMKPNAWGLHDMHGNVWEWCLDGYVETLPGGKDPVSPQDGTDGVLRSGSWNYNSPLSRAASRRRESPSKQGYAIGIRVAVVPVLAQPPAPVEEARDHPVEVAPSEAGSTVPSEAAPSPEPAPEPSQALAPGLQKLLDAYLSARRSQVIELAGNYARALEGGVESAARSGDRVGASAYRHEQARLDVFLAEHVSDAETAIAAVRNPGLLSPLPKGSSPALSALRKTWRDQIGKIDARLRPALSQSLLHMGKELTRARDFLSARQVVDLQEELVSGSTVKPAALAAGQVRARQEIWARRLGTSVEFKNTIGMQLQLIPPGRFLMGCSDEQHAELAGSEPQGKEFPEMFAAERPQHVVAITRPIAIGAHEVTTGQFRQFVEATGYVTEFEKKHNDRAWNRNLNYQVTDNCPVVRVTWQDAVAFCQWLAKQEGGSYRLPTEAEWEYVCRAGTRDNWAGGRAGLGDRAVMQAKHVMPVGGKQANALGLFDLQGNVMEWCQDRFAGDYYAKSPPLDPSGPGEGGYRIVRGGSFKAEPNNLRPAKRGWVGPGEGSDDRGFRVVREL